MEKNDGGSAFPGSAPIGVAAEQAAAIGRPIEASGGMSLRDYFAAAALQGIMEWDAIVNNRKEKRMPIFAESGAEKRIAGIAYKIADAMLAERNK